MHAVVQTERKGQHDIVASRPQPDRRGGSTIGIALRFARPQRSGRSWRQARSIYRVRGLAGPCVRLRRGRRRAGRVCRQLVGILFGLAGAVGDQATSLEDFLPANMVIGALGVGQFGAGSRDLTSPRTARVGSTLHLDRVRFSHSLRGSRCLRRSKAHTCTYYAS